jgi:hypothetical protein
LLTGGGRIVGWCQDTVDLPQPGDALLQVSILIGEGEQGGLEALMQAEQPGVIAMGQQLFTEGNNILETLIGLAASLAEGRSSFESQQVGGKQAAYR